MTPDKELAKQLAPQIWLHIRGLVEKDTWFAAMYSTMLIDIAEARGIDANDHDELVKVEADLCLQTGFFLARAVGEGDMTVEDILNEKNDKD